MERRMVVLRVLLDFLVKSTYSEVLLFSLST